MRVGLVGILNNQFRIQEKKLGHTNERRDSQRERERDGSGGGVGVWSVCVCACVYPQHFFFSPLLFPSNFVVLLPFPDVLEFAAPSLPPFLFAASFRSK